MACDECEKCKELGYKFCKRCGAPLIEKQSPKPVSEKTFTPVVNLSTIVFAIAATLSLVLMIIFFKDGWDFVSGKYWKPFLYIPTVVRLPAVPMSLMFVFFVAVVVICFTILMKKSLPFFKNGFKDEKEETPLYWLGLVFGATLMIETIINIVMTSLGVQISTPESMQHMTLAEAIWSMTEAGVWEEVAFRLVLIGLPMAIAAAVYRKKDCWKHLFGGSGISILSLVLLLISTVIFAYAHIGGWGYWKAIPVAVGGFALGYIFLRFGLYASIMFHFVNDYAMVWTLTSSMLSMLLMLIMLIGIVCIIPVMCKLVKGARNLKQIPTTGFDQRSN